MNKKVILILIFIFTILGVGVSSYLVDMHYSNETGLCTIDETFDCNKVNTSEYSTFAGVPVAVMGLIGYIILSIIGVLLIKREDKWTLLTGLLIVLSMIALVFSLYLTYIEITVIRALCIFCIISQITIFIIFLLSLLNLAGKKL